MKLRKRLFVDQNHWSIPHNTSVEWDQYDNPNTIYAITHNDGKPVAASRINPCNFESGGWSYMIRDAALGRLDGIPEDIIDNPTTRHDVWEATRFTADPDLSSGDRNAALSENAKALATAAKDTGAAKLIALMPPAFTRWLSSAGLPTFRIGPKCFDNEGKRICVMEMPLQL
ncbi:acyl-homoserine-lactone synthase [Ruegeria sp. Ofav3-42]|uniref:acyl-homoserine-lactone synthase n=1 Tax=Ruegeria sp. Ofav3-42 TaxID=2917759 RepID=UPI001EF6B208|nr:acyl-homoserine-lactone synthase [Ruegeria sp. Ofav3-42]MCG7520869.1 autoinducer synthase [Ruegeria sp. Ofav3-42]